MKSGITSRITKTFETHVSKNAKGNTVSLPTVALNGPQKECVANTADIHKPILQLNHHDFIHGFHLTRYQSAPGGTGDSACILLKSGSQRRYKFEV